MDAGDQDTVRQFRAIAELHGDVAWIIDLSTGLPSYISDAIAPLLGYCLDDFTAWFRTPDSASPLAALCSGLDQRLQRFAAGDLSRQRLQRTYEQPHRDGRVIPIEITSTLVLDAAGVPAALAGTLRDVSEQRERAAQQRRFVSMLNHEFRTPLSTIDGAIQRLEVTGAQADEATRARYKKIQAAVDRLISMMDDYLSPERLAEVGNSKPAGGVSPALLLKEAAEQLSAAGRKSIVDIGHLPRELRCQPDGLRLALKVLVDNALQYSSPDSAIMLAGHQADGGIAFLVRDGGAGVPEAELLLVFEKGYRGSNAVGNGSGLGLYMARSVIDVHGGNITVQNVARYGAEFKIWLPAQAGAGKSVASGVINSDNSAHQLQG
ncbi:MAG: PAS domain-containing sensor histidine kinase [Telluria sp.]|nr:PAS domain-containing sensor histidine kinase [Telluria sp.]